MKVSSVLTFVFQNFSNLKVIYVLMAQTPRFDILYIMHCFLTQFQVSAVILVLKEILGVYGSNVWYAMTMTCVQLAMKQEPPTHATLQIIPCSAYSPDQTMVGSFCYTIVMTGDFMYLFHFWTDTFYGGESITSDTPQSFSCPYCGKLGYTETGLYDHVTSDHTETPYEVVMIL